MQDHIPLPVLKHLLNYSFLICQKKKKKTLLGLIKQLISATHFGNALQIFAVRKYCCVCDMLPVSSLYSVLKFMLRYALVHASILCCSFFFLCFVFCNLIILLFCFVVSIGYLIVLFIFWTNLICSSLQMCTFTSQGWRGFWAL